MYPLEDQKKKGWNPNLPVTEQTVGVLGKVTFEKACLLAKLGITTIGDLFFNIPIRYEDRRNVKTIASIEKGEEALILGTVKACEMKKIRQGKKFFTRVIFYDETGDLFAYWWNQSWPMDVFREGQLVILYGKVRKIYPPELANPEYEILYGDGIVRFCFGKIIPVYSLTEGISQYWIRSLIARALKQYLDQLPIGRQYDELELPSHREAVRMLHYPSAPGEEELGRKRLAMDELLELQLEMQKRKNNLLKKIHGIKCLGNNQLVRPFLKNLGFKLTSSQTDVLKEIRVDLSSGIPMRRLLQGDVGAGKTVVAACTALMVIEGGYNVVLMAPTEILAIQHVSNFRRWFEPLGITVRIWTGRAKEKDDDYKLLKNDSNPCVVIGTHALIEDSFRIDNLGLVVIDEQHKFGVEQRDRLLKKGSNAHLLVMTATPIPRTLALTLYGELDISVMKTLPSGRGKIRTFIRERERLNAVLDFVKKQLSQGRQAYVICPLIDESSNPDLKAVESEFSHISEVIFPYKAGLLHGRMKGNEKEYVMNQFSHNLIHLLLTTSVVEVGVDVPNATVMLIENAERFGLAQIHQLRGRIGRGKEDSYCILIVEAKDVDSMERLRILETTQNGFQIAEEDLKLRGPGDFLGDRQHGLPSFRFADLLNDYALAQYAKKIAINIVRQGINE